MASRAVVLSFTNAQPTYNDSIILTSVVAFMEKGSLITEDVPVTVGINDTVVQIGSAIATRIRARALELNFTAIGVNNVLMPSYSKA